MICFYLFACGIEVYDFGLSRACDSVCAHTREILMLLNQILNFYLKGRFPYQKQCYIVITL